MLPKSRPQLGPNAVIDPQVHLDVPTGRRLAKNKALKIGKLARIRSGSALYRGTVIGNHLETGHGVVIREENTIGHHFSIWNHSTIDYGCTIGNRVKIHCNVYVAQFSILEDDVFLAPGVVLANDLFPGSKQAMQALQGPVIRRGAQIGVNCTVLPGVEIGEGALIGSGSVVTRDIPPHSVAWGNPARVRRMRPHLKWPGDYKIRRPAAQALYQRKIAGKPAY